MLETVLIIVSHARWNLGAFDLIELIEEEVNGDIEYFAEFKSYLLSLQTSMNDLEW